MALSLSTSSSSFGRLASSSSSSSLLLLLFLLFFLFPSACSGYRFGILVKSFNNEFFHLAEQGCIDYVNTFLLSKTENSSTCIYNGPLPTPENPNPDPDGTVQANMLLEMITGNTTTNTLPVDAVAISVKNAIAITPAIQMARNAGIPVVTFDSDAPESSRIAYIGTDNRFLGTTLAKVAKQISPQGGYFATLASDDSPNMQERIRGFQEEMLAENEDDKKSSSNTIVSTDGENNNNDNTIVWTELSESPGIFFRDVDAAIDMMEEYAQQDATVIVSVNGGPMWSDYYADFYNRNRHRNITLVFGDDFPLQIDYLSRGYVLGLVGQMPYEMGYRSTAALHQLLSGMDIPDTIGTNLISHLQVPLVLPHLDVDHSLIGNMKIIGYILFGMIMISVIGCVLWTYCYRNLSVVKAAQPIFLLWVAFGVFIMAGALIPLSLDDKGDPDSLTEYQGSVICMSVPWLTWCGFTITFSALYSKTRRITKLIASARECQRIEVSPMDVAGPFIFLFSLNVVLLSLWTALDPLIYVREANPGTDGWNRILSTYGACRSDHVARYLVPLAIVNCSVLVLANWQAYVSRRIKSEFAESKYIAFCMVSLLQALVTGFPVIYVVRDSPQAYYLVMAFMIFVICMAVLLLVFVPKMVLADDFARRSDQSQRHIMVNAIRRSTVVVDQSGKFGASARSGGQRGGSSDLKYGIGPPSSCPSGSGFRSGMSSEASTSNSLKNPVPAAADIISTRSANYSDYAVAVKDGAGGGEEGGDDGDKNNNNNNNNAGDHQARAVVPTSHTSNSSAIQEDDEGDEEAAAPTTATTTGNKEETTQPVVSSETVWTLTCGDPSEELQNQQQQEAAPPLNNKPNNNTEE